MSEPRRPEAPPVNAGRRRRRRRPKPGGGAARALLVLFCLAPPAVLFQAPVDYARVLAPDGADGAVTAQ
ncbi:hypothetical protein [Streptomyces clavuligerus]|uniref:hypothetical protein n=1 Tax=Streptomyces clavuligerus TaxID=1901 RepID=UPI0001800CFA|nr:hypothetical protein [Streptomyces clavuligerus]ANW21303.1 hypothetical protein BB341_25380 [Streptomyces clavuligerus]EDY52809.1 hypothetical protein SSCG_05844 [Streptomyces clavuligerus]MBY6306057.1 hypothetical protein [Streptomyces clavuligerus]QPJ91954.1 hypothetical protein GE265_02410 [Streptomyces clavuligerus]QPL65920.1 hypothetical protein I3J04_25700 [Streptomyces clavuligerus]